MFPHIPFYLQSGGGLTLRYILNRIASSIVTLWLLVTLTFCLMHLLPGDPFIGRKAVPDSIKQSMFRKYDLDKPIYIQYGKYMLNLLKGDLGDSLLYKNRPVLGIIKQAFPYSFDLGLRALIFAVAAGIPLGIAAALNHNRKTDSAVMIISMIGVSIPGFIIGALLQYFVALRLSQLTEPLIGIKLLPISGWTHFNHKLLPPIALGLSSLAIIARLMRTSMLDILGQDYIKTARAKGLSRIMIIRKHMIRNAILPVVTVLGPLAASLLTGAFVIENIFNIPGMGRFFVQSIQSNDYPMITGTTLFYGAFLIIANMLVDIAYMIIDPRVRLFTKRVKLWK